jgi:uncharacterized protein (TIGR03435 family)
MDLHALRNSVFYACVAVYGVANAQTPSFEVATIKPVDPSYHFDGKRFWVHINPAGASYYYMTLDSLITHAYDLESFQVTGGPDWANTEHFDIETKFPEGADKKDEPKMLQTLLKDRFKLTFHIEKKELEGYVLEVAKNGANLKLSPPDPASLESSPAQPAESNAVDAPAKPKVTQNKDGSTSGDLGKRGNMTIKFDPETWTQHFEWSKITMEDLASRLSLCLGEGGHKVTDETGLQGTYQVAYDCPMPGRRPPRPAPTSTATAPPTASDPNDGPSLTRSLEAMGLKLEKRKMLTDVYILDHIERPSAN